MNSTKAWGGTDDEDMGERMPLKDFEGHEAQGLPVEEPVTGLPLEPRPAGFGALPFRTGLFQVCSDVDLCCYGTFCTPCLYGENVRQLKELHGEQGASCIPPCCTLLSMSTAAQLVTVGAVTGAGLAAAGGAGASPAAVMAITRFAQNLGDLAGSCTSAGITSRSRSSLRRKFGLAENMHFSDFWIHFWCGPCAVCQEAREIRGFLNDAAAQRQYGWNNTATAAPTEQAMGSPVIPSSPAALEYSPDNKPQRW
mmetsp:Transcript_3228/g.9179  ORF Transcript_3228/g.9179 Transcript_3228/m.9179 type:complete len:253 (-) Transcript_3228:276-1034(-)